MQGCKIILERLFRGDNSIFTLDKTKLVFSVLLGGTIFLAFPTEASADENGGNLEKQGCMHCHSLDGKGGLIGPPFDNISKFRSKEYIVKKLTIKAPIPQEYPRSYPDPKELMNHVRLNKVTSEKIADYLINHKSSSEWSVKGHGGMKKDDVPLGSGFAPHPVSKDSRAGLALYRDKGCAACHSISLIGGRMGPALDGIGAKRSRKFIENRISLGAVVSYGDREYKPSSYSMPSMNLSQKEVRQITEFLLTLPVEKND